jgi:hypothetical protein
MHFFQKTFFKKIRPSPSAWAYIFFKFNRAHNTSSAPFIRKKNDMSSVHSQNPARRLLWWPKKHDLLFFCLETHFQHVFCPKHLGNPLKTLLNQYLFMENVKNHPKTWNSPENIKTSRAQIWLFRCFQCKKTRNLNSLHHIEPFDKKKNYCFGGRIPHQRTLSLSELESNNLISLLQWKRDWKISKIEFGIQIEFCKIQGIDHLIAKIDKELKWIFYRNFQSVIYVICFFHFSSLSFNSTLSYKKKKKHAIKL